MKALKNPPAKNCFLFNKRLNVPRMKIAFMSCYFYSAEKSVSKLDLWKCRHFAKRKGCIVQSSEFRRCFNNYFSFVCDPI